MSKGSSLCSPHIIKQTAQQRRRGLDKRTCRPRSKEPACCAFNHGQIGLHHRAASPSAAASPVLSVSAAGRPTSVPLETTARRFPTNVPVCPLRDCKFPNQKSHQGHLSLTSEKCRRLDPVPNYKHRISFSLMISWVSKLPRTKTPFRHVRASLSFSTALHCQKDKGYSIGKPNCSGNLWQHKLTVLQKLSISPLQYSRHSASHLKEELF